MRDPIRTLKTTLAFKWSDPEANGLRATIGELDSVHFKLLGGECKLGVFGQEHAPFGFILFSRIILRLQPLNL